MGQNIKTILENELRFPEIEKTETDVNMFGRKLE